jgi:hypothetical protein
MGSRPAALARRHPVLAALWLVVALGAVVQMTRLSVFMVDAERGSMSVMPGRTFFRSHSCLSSFTEAARFAAEGHRNVYDPRLYSAPGCGDDLLKCSERPIGPLLVDIYQYPPAFLALPALVRVATGDFFLIRTAWFFVQVGLLAAATLLLARWIGGRSGAIAAALSVLLWASPSSLLGIQIGNFQATAYALSVLGMVALATGRLRLGGTAVGFAAASKLYPGVLFAYLVARRAWRPAAWILAGGVLSTGVAMALVGTRPFVDFVQYQFPRLNSADAFFWVDLPPAVPINYGIYGFLGRLRLLGVLDSTRETGALVSSVYGGVLFIAAIAAGWSRARSRPALDDGGSRLREAQLWLALLNLGSFRSPFVPDAYALMGTTWLLTLVAAEWRSATGARALALAAAAVMFALVFDGIWVAEVPRWVVLLTLGNQLLALGLNAGVLGRAILAARAETTTATERAAPSVAGR